MVALSAVGGTLSRHVPPEDLEPVAAPPAPRQIEVARGVFVNTATHAVRVVKDPVTPAGKQAKPAATSGLTDSHLRTVAEQRVPLLNTHLAHGREALARLGPKSVGTPAWKAAMTEYLGAKTALQQDRAAVTRSVQDVNKLRATADSEDRRVLGDAASWGQQQTARIDAALATGSKPLAGAQARDPDLIRPGEKVALKFDAPALRVVTNEEVRWDLRTKADNNGLGGGEAERVARDAASINDPLRLTAQTDPMGYAAQRLALDNGSDLEYQQVLQRVLPGVRGDYTQAHVTQALARGDMPGAIGIVKTNLDHSGNRAERHDVWQRVAGRFTEPVFAAQFDKVPETPGLSSLSPNLRGEYIGERVKALSAQGLPPEIATPLAAAVKTSVLDRWNDASGSVGPRLYAGLSRLAESADVPYSDAAPITPGLTKWLVQRIDVPNVMIASTPTEFDIAGATSAGDAKLSVALARALDNPDHATQRGVVIDGLKDGTDQLRDDTRDAYDAWSKERSAIDFVGRNFSDPTKPQSTIAQVQAFRGRNPQRADAIDQHFLALGAQGQRAAQVVQDVTAGGVFGTRDELHGADARLDEALAFARGSRGPIQTDYKNGDQQKVMFAIQNSPQQRQAADNELLFSPTGASADSATRWAGEAHRFIGAMATSVDHQTGAALLSTDQARALDASVARWQTSMQAEVGKAQPDDAAITRINDTFDQSVRSIAGDGWIAGQLRSDLPIKRHGPEELHLGAVQIRMVKNAVDLFGEAYLNASVKGTLREFSAQRLQASGASLANAVDQSPLLSRYAGNPGWMPWLGVDRNIGTQAGQIAAANAAQAEQEIAQLAAGPQQQAQVQAIVDRYRRQTETDIAKQIDLHGQQTPFSDPSRGAFGVTMRAIGGSTNALNAYNQLVLRAGEDRADPALLMYGAFSAATAARDGIAIAGMAAGRNLAVDSTVFKLGSKAIGVGWVLPEVVYFKDDVLPSGTTTEKLLQGATVVGQVAESLSLVGLEADVAAGLTTGGVGTLVVAGSQLALMGYYQAQSVRDSNLYEVGGAPALADALGVGFSSEQMQDKAGVQSALADLGFRPDQARELLNQTGHGVSPMLAINQWGESKGLSFQQRMDYLRRLTPAEIRDTLVPDAHDLIDNHMDTQTLKIPATSPEDTAVRHNGMLLDPPHGRVTVATKATSQVTSLANLDVRLGAAGVGYDTVIARPWTSPLPPTTSPRAPTPAATPQPVIELHTVERGDTLWDLYGGAQGLKEQAYPTMPWFDPAKENGDPFSG